MTEEDWYQAAIRDYEIEEIPYSELNADKKKKIGQGGFSKIYETNHETKGTLAIKKIVKNEVYKVFNRELKVHSQIEHKRIIRFHGISRDEQQGYYFVLELANQGNLREFTEKNKDNDNFNWEERQRLACQIAEGLCYLHEKDIAHCDLHTKNILINDGDIKISDFGLSKDLNSAIGSSNNKIFGIIPFIDPQKFHDSKFVLDKTSDIYSLGVVLWEISSCRTPFLKELYNWDLVYKIRNGKREKPVKGTPIQYKQIYTDCWQFKSDSRPSIDNVLSRLQSMSIEREQVIEEDNGNSSDDASGNPDTGYDYPTISDMTIPDRVSAFLHNGTSGNRDSQPNPDSVSETLGNNPTVCKNCGKFKHHYWCRECEAKAFQKDQNWTSGNKDLDELIKNSQLNVKNHKYFVWINYDQLRNIEPTAQGSYCEKKFYTATWLNGIRGWNDSSQEWTRSGPVKIILQKFKLESTIKNLELHLKIENVIDCYGFTQDSNTNYYMVLKYVNGGNLRNYVWNNYPLSWFKRLLILKKIVRIISKIHDAKYIHRDLYPGNILIQEADGWDEIELDVYISELDSCANLDSKIEQQQYGNLLYIAPEVIVSSGNETSIKSDVYSIGMIMWELASGDEPYSNRGTDKDELIRDIINGAHPNDVIETPECYRELMQKCLNVDPEKRPITSDLLDMLLTFTEVPLKKQFEVANRRIRGQGSKDNNEITKGQSYPEFRFTNQPLSKIFSDAQEIEERMEEIKIDN